LAEEEIWRMRIRITVGSWLRGLLVGVGIAIVVLAFGPVLGEVDAMSDATTCLPNGTVCINEHNVHWGKHCAGGQCVTCVSYPGAVCSEQGGEVSDHRGEEVE
jgi:hypothetical protein